MNGRVLLRCVAFAAFTAASGCSTNPPACTAPPIAVTPVVYPMMVSPADGATGLPASGFTVQIAFAVVAYGEQLRLVDQDGHQLVGGRFTPLLPPSPAPSFGPQANAEAAVPQLAPHTTYTVFVDGSSPRYAGSACLPGGGGPFSDRIGSFTTA